MSASVTQNELDAKIARLNTQSTQIEDKSNVALTRNRMLEIVQERNIFARKLYYSLISLIIFIIVFALVIYSMKK
jgi:hypothetical protein